jgi:hypothetical protein
MSTSLEQTTQSDYGDLAVTVLVEPQRDVKVEMVSETINDGLGFRCVEGKPPKQGDEIWLRNSSFQVLWTKVQSGETLFGVRF